MQAKIVPTSSSSKTPDTQNIKETPPSKKRYVIRLLTLIERYGGQKHPKVESFSKLLKEGELVEWNDIPLRSTKVYVSSERAGTKHPDPRGVHTRHLLQMFQRLGQGKIPRVDMET